MIITTAEHSSTLRPWILGDDTMLLANGVIYHLPSSYVRRADLWHWVMALLPNRTSHSQSHLETSLSTSRWREHIAVLPARMFASSITSMSSTVQSLLDHVMSSVPSVGSASLRDRVPSTTRPVYGIRCPGRSIVITSISSSFVYLQPVPYCPRIYPATKTPGFDPRCWHMFVCMQWLALSIPYTPMLILILPLSWLLSTWNHLMDIIILPSHHSGHYRLPYPFRAKALQPHQCI